jgi:prepilin-type N-terminal cleavage/methylation domain-containing protein/prepilin-type processing-associated H-X9-DG protein
MNWSNPVAEAPPGRKPGQQGAFTLIELLVVIAIIGVLSSLLLPSLAQSKSQAQGAFCQNNTRQLLIGCLMYCDDNEGFFPYNLAGTAAQTNINWAGDLLNWETDSGNTNTSLLTAVALGPYVAQSSAVFHCPSDTALSAIQRSLGWQNRARSYSMNSSVGNVGTITELGVNIYNPNYIQFFKLSSMPAAAQIFVFTEEHPDTIYDGYFINSASSNEWTRLPASYHGGGANISFADGHAELHHWQDASTKPPAEPDTAEVFTALPPGQQSDFNWVVAHMSVIQQPQQPNW